MKWEFPDSCQTASFQLHARQTPVNTKSLNTSLMLFLLLIYNRHQKGSNWQVHAQIFYILFPLKGSHICVHLCSGVNNLNQTLTLTVQYSQHGPRISQFAPAIWLAESFRLSGKSPAKKCKWRESRHLLNSEQSTTCVREINVSMYKCRCQCIADILTDTKRCK